MFEFLGIGAVVVVIILLVLLFKVLKSPLKLILKLLFNAAVGFAALFALNWVCGSLGLNYSLDTNLVNCLVAGVLGLPGVILLLLLKYLF